jgi:hypothetical protein
MNINKLNDYISTNDINNTLKLCYENQQYYLGYLISKIYLDISNNISNNIINDINKYISIFSEKLYDNINLNLYNVDNNDIINYNNKTIKIMLLCNWLDTKDITELWNKMSKGNYKWNNIELVLNEPVDYYVVINSPPIHIFPDKKKTIIFHMEPNIDININLWGYWSNPLKSEFAWIGYHKNEYNNNEWHLNKTYNELLTEKIEKDINKNNILSTIISNKYRDPGHIKRIDFIKFLEAKNMIIDVYGGNKFDWINYKGELPYHNKNNGILPYKYTFNAENFEIRNYYTEKLIDGILGECLTFYWGCPNIPEHIDPRAYVKLELYDFEKDYQTIKKAIDEDWWSQRIEFIRNEKQKILNDKQFFPRLEKIIKQINNK